MFQRDLTRSDEELTEEVSAASLDHLHHRSYCWRVFVYLDRLYPVAGLDLPFTQDLEIVSGPFGVEKCSQDSLGSKSQTKLVARKTGLRHGKFCGPYTESVPDVNFVLK